MLIGCASAPEPVPPLEAAEVPAPSPKDEPRAEVPALAEARLLDATRLPPFEGERRDLEQPRSVARLDRTQPPADLWQRLRNGFAMQDIDSPQVAERTAWYVANQDYLTRVFDRSRLYLYHIVEELEKRGMPTEIALLPIVESAFNPMAYSRAHASGLWQFIPGTGKRYELKQNMWYDGRRDIVDSTNAALDYLKDVYDMHGDWHLALASYNWGENAVARAIEKNRRAGQPTDYLSLPMPRETRGYVPKLQALKNLIANPQAYGVTLAPIPNEPYFATVSKTRDIDVQLAARLAEMDVDEFVALNPGFSRPLIRTSVAARIVLPADKVDVFHDNLEALGDKSLVSWKTYYPKAGETFESVAKKHGLHVSQLKEVNGISPRTRAVPRLLVVPTSTAPTTRLPIMYAPPIAVSTKRIFHTVQKGETLASIASKHRVSAEDLKRWNGVERAVPGRKLAVEVRATPVRSKSRPKAKPRKRA